MRSTTTLLSLLAAAASAPAVFAAPIPGSSSLSAEWERRLAAQASRTSLRLHTLSPEAAAALADETGPNAIVIDNRHYTPSGDIAPSVVLATPRPIVTTYLMGLGPKPVTPNDKDAAPKDGSPVPICIQNTHEGIEVVIIDADVEEALEAAKAIAGTPDSTPIISPVAVDPLEPAEHTALQQIDDDAAVPESIKMESQPAHHKSRPATDVPCHYAQLRRENDMVVIGLVAIFLLVIVAVELYDSSTVYVPFSLSSRPLSCDVSSFKFHHIIHFTSTASTNITKQGNPGRSRGCH